MIGLSALILFVSLCATMINAELYTLANTGASYSPSSDATGSTTLILGGVTDIEVAPATQTAPATCGGTTAGTAATTGPPAVAAVPAAITIDLKSPMVVNAIHLYIKAATTTPALTPGTNNAAKVTVSVGTASAIITSAAGQTLCSTTATATAVFDTSTFKAAFTCSVTTPVQYIVISADPTYVTTGIYLCSYQVDTPATTASTTSTATTSTASTAKAANATVAAKSVTVSRFDWIMLLTMSLAAIVKMVGVGQE